jgi:hypothetical protein
LDVSCMLLIATEYMLYLTRTWLNEWTWSMRWLWFNEAILKMGFIINSTRTK